MGLQDFQGSTDKMVSTDVLEKRGILDHQEIMKTQSLVKEGFLDHPALPGSQDLQGLQAWDFQVQQGKEVQQESQDVRARGALMVQRGSEVTPFLTM